MRVAASTLIGRSVCASQAFVTHGGVNETPLPPIAGLIVFYGHLNSGLPSICQFLPNLYFSTIKTEMTEQCSDRKALETFCAREDRGA